MIEAREYFEAALQLEGASWQAHFGAVMGLADIDRREEAWQESISKWNEAIGIARTHANAIYESFAIRGLGETWFDRGDMSRAEPLLKRSLALVDNRSDLPECLAELWSWNGDTERARDYSRQVTTIMASHFAAESPALASALVSEAILEQRGNRAGRRGRTLREGVQHCAGNKTVQQPLAGGGPVVCGRVVAVASRSRAKQIVAEASVFRAK